MDSPSSWAKAAMAQFTWSVHQLSLLYLTSSILAAFFAYDSPLGISWLITNFKQSSLAMQTHSYTIVPHTLSEACAGEIARQPQCGYQDGRGQYKQGQAAIYQGNLYFTGVPRSQYCAFLGSADTGGVNAPCDGVLPRR